MPADLHTFDLDVVRGVLARRPDALDDFVERMRCVPRILAAYNARLGRQLDEHDLADLTQEVLVQVWRRLPEYEGRSELEGWVYRFCVLQTMNALRRKRRGDHHELDESFPESRVPEPSSGHDEVEEGLARVPGNEAVIIRLRHFEGMSLKAVAERLGQPASSVKSRYHRGLDRLAAFLRSRREEASG
jgi:RNA polymerase sigma-70 factor (ECF subfamily)